MEGVPLPPAGGAAGAGEGRGGARRRVGGGALPGGVQMHSARYIDTCPIVELFWGCFGGVYFFRVLDVAGFAVAIVAVAASAVTLFDVDAVFTVAALVDAAAVGLGKSPLPNKLFELML